MENREQKAIVKNRAGQWLGDSYDADTRAAVRKMLDDDDQDLIECFYRDLDFGTGGLRGVMGVGTNRMNVYTVSMATQGLCNYLKKEWSAVPQIKVAVAHDSRTNSRLFAETAAGIFSANGFKVYLFEDLRPTPELSFAIRYFKCQSGIVITASHNPKEYNGYKAYWDDGGQITAPHDSLIIQEVQRIRSMQEVNLQGRPENIETIGKEFDEIYTDQITELSLSPEVVRSQKDMKIVYTPLHGSGVRLVPLSLRKFGFTNVISVPEQNVPDGNFPTLRSPNPEDSAALSMAIQKAREHDADLVMATDPDADRVGIVVRDKKGNYVVLNGNQAATLLIDYLLRRWSETGKLKGNEYIAKTIVTTDLLRDLASSYRVPCYEVLTGFKYIAELIRSMEGQKVFIGGGEESYGYLAGDFVRDKDAIISCSLIAEAAAFAKEQGMTLMDRLTGIYREFGLYKERLVSLEKKGKAGLEEIFHIMQVFRKHPPQQIDKVRVTEVRDYLSDASLEAARKKNFNTPFPKSDVLQFFLKDGSKVSIRPSGTEPKIKFYFAVRGNPGPRNDFEQFEKELDAKIDRIIRELKIN